MVIGNQFLIGHIGKTAGDAIKQLVGAVQLPGVATIPIESPRKHSTFRQWNGDLSKFVLALSIRRMPTFLLSQFQHRFMDGRLAAPPSGDLMCEDYAPDFYLRLYTDDGRLPIKYWLRSESIRQDLTEFLGHFFPLTPEQKTTLLSAPTKASLPYNHDWRSVFAPRHLKLMYAKNPLWAEVEHRVYGSVLDQ